MNRLECQLRQLAKIVLWLALIAVYGSVAVVAVLMMLGIAGLGPLAIHP